MQTPVKTGYEKLVKGVERITKMLEVTKLSAEAKAEVLMLLDQAEAVAKQVKEDGSWGVHAAHYLKQRVETAQSYIDQAQAIIDAGLTTAKK